MARQKLVNGVVNKLERENSERGSAKRDTSTAETRNRLKFTVKTSDNQLNHLTGNFRHPPDKTRTCTVPPHHTGRAFTTQALQADVFRWFRWMITWCQHC